MRRFVLVTLLLLGLTACMPPSKDDILQSAAGVETTEELRRALGDPDERSKLGPIETWTYEASDGEVKFVITDGKLRLQATLDADDR